MAKPTEDELKEFFFITKIHKNLVAHLGRIFNDADYQTHDDSKFQAPEVEPYALKFARMLSNDENPAWKAAVEHHYYNNDHHVQYWRHKKQNMPEKNMKEAIIDMMAAKFQYQLNRDIVEKVRVNEYKIDESILIGSLEEYLLKDDLYYFDEKFLTPYTDDEKDFIKKQLKIYQGKMVMHGKY